MNATYVSVWDGDTEVRTSCQFNSQTKVASDIETADVDDMDLNFLSEEYIELPSGEIIKTFTTDDGRNVVDGIADGGDEY